MGTPTINIIWFHACPADHKLVCAPEDSGVADLYESDCQNQFEVVDKLLRSLNWLLTQEEEFRVLYTDVQDLLPCLTIASEACENLQFKVFVIGKYQMSHPEQTLFTLEFKNHASLQMSVALERNPKLEWIPFQGVCKIKIGQHLLQFTAGDKIYRVLLDEYNSKIWTELKANHKWSKFVEAKTKAGGGHCDVAIADTDGLRWTVLIRKESKLVAVGETSEILSNDEWKMMMGVTQKIQGMLTAYKDTIPTDLTTYEGIEMGGNTYHITRIRQLDIQPCNFRMLNLPRMTKESNTDKSKQSTKKDRNKNKGRRKDGNKSTPKSGNTSKSGSTKFGSSKSRKN